MGRGKRYQPEKLAEKLLEIRTRLDLTQTQVLRFLDGVQSNLHASHISGYELGTREPPLDVLLMYARRAGVPMEVLVDDNMELPRKLPSEQTYEWIPVAMESRKP